MVDINLWLKEAKEEADASGCGMYLIHNGVVRLSSKDEARNGKLAPKVKAMSLSCDMDTVNEALKKVQAMTGIKCVKMHINTGMLKVGDDIMYVLVGGDIRPNVIACLESFVAELKGNCIKEEEIYE